MFIRMHIIRRITYTSAQASVARIGHIVGIIITTTAIVVVVCCVSVSAIIGRISGVYCANFATIQGWSMILVCCGQVVAGDSCRGR